MRHIPRGAWQYAALLLILFAIAALAARSTVDYLQELVGQGRYEEALRGTTYAVWALTMGFMFLAAAFGLWAIQFSAEAESFRRIGLFVEDMYYLRDGLAALDKRGYITASNPALKAMLAPRPSDRPLTEAFPCLRPVDLTLLLGTESPYEVERQSAAPEGERTYRFRSQPTAGMRLVLVSDITRNKAEEARRQHLARLQLIGRIARGVAHDFNNILCTVSGHASLLPRLRPASEEAAAAVQAIVREAQRGSNLAGHLLELARAGGSSRMSAPLGEHVLKAAELLRLGLASGWEVQVNAAENLPAVNLPGIEIEQAIVNLGLVAADALPEPGVVVITASRKAAQKGLNAPDRFAATVLVSALGSRADREWMKQPLPDDLPLQQTPVEDMGAIESVVRTMIEDAGGSLDLLRFSDGSLFYRIAMPPAPAAGPVVETDSVSNELRSYVAGWHVALVQSDPPAIPDLADRLRAIGMGVEEMATVTVAISRLGRGKPLDGLLLDKQALGQECDGLLRVIGRLCPGTGIVVLSGEPPATPDPAAEGAVFVFRARPLNEIVQALIEARGVALRRQNR